MREPVGKAGTSMHFEQHLRQIYQRHACSNCRLERDQAWRLLQLVEGEQDEFVPVYLHSRRSGVHGLLGRAQRHAAALQRMHDVLQVLHRAGEAINAGHNHGVTGLHEVEQHLQLGSSVAAGAACLLGANDFAARRLEGRTLDRKILVEGADGFAAVGGYFVPKGSRPGTLLIQ